MIANLTCEENGLKAMQMRDEVAQVLLSGSDRWARIDFRYDWMGRRISKMYQTTNDDPAVYSTKPGPPIAWSIDRCVRYGWDGWHLSLSYRANPNGAYLGPDQSFAWGPDLSSSLGGAGGIGGLVAYCDDDYDANNHPDPDLGPMYPIYDGNGNVVRMCRFAAVGSGGFEGVECRTAAAYEYGPFGEALSVTGEDLGPSGGGGQGQRNPFRFSTKYTDAETGLVYYGYRYYSPGMGRWVSRDPIGEGDGPNIFAVVRNDSISFVDPLGLCKKRDVHLFLTFDDGPVAGTDDILNNLRAKSEKATFFMIADALYTTNNGRRNLHPTRLGYVKRVIDEGHLLGNHSASHSRKTYEMNGAHDPQAAVRDFADNVQFFTDALQTIAMTLPSTFTTYARLPGANTWDTGSITRDGGRAYGNATAGPAAALRRAGYKVYGWDVEWGHGGTLESPSDMVSKIEKFVAQKETEKAVQVILLAHDKHFRTTIGNGQKLSEFIDELRKSAALSVEFKRLDAYK